MPRFQCATCGDVFDNGDELAAHIREDHMASGGAPSFECNICNQRFNDEGSLVAHMAEAHPKKQ